MRRLSILGALNLKAKSGDVALIDGLDKVGGKTAVVATLLSRIAGNDRSVLLLTSQRYSGLVKATKNLPQITLMPATATNVLKVLKTKKLIIDQAALKPLEDWLTK